MCTERRERRGAWGRVGVVALAALIVLGLPLQLGVGGLAGPVAVSAGATQGTVHYDFESSTTFEQQDAAWQRESGDAWEGSYAMDGDTSRDGFFLKMDLPSQQYDTQSIRYKTVSYSSGGYYSSGMFSDGGDVGPSFCVGEGGSLNVSCINNDGVDTGYDVPAGQWVHIAFENVDYGTQTHDIAVYDQSGDELFRYENAEFYESWVESGITVSSTGRLVTKVISGHVKTDYVTSGGVGVGSDATPAVDKNEQTFILADQSGLFPASETELYAWKAGSDGSVTGGIQSSDSFNYQNETTLTLVDDETYLLEVRNEYTGDTYEVFPFTYQEELSGDYTIYIDASLARNETQNQTESIPPSVWIEKDPLVPTVDQTVTFTADAFDPDSNITSYRWEFPGGTDTGQTVQRSWSTTGLRDVTVTVTTDDNETATYTGTVYVGEQPPNLAPRVYFDYDPLLPTAGESVTFTADASDSDGEIVSRTWYIDGERVGSGERLTTSFRQRGSYTVTLAVEDNASATAEYEALVTVASEETAAGQDPTALGTCLVPGSGDMGILIEYYDPSYSTSTLNYNVEWNGTTYSGTKQFDSPKGYYMGCLAHEDIDQDDDGVPDVGDGENESAPPEWVINGSYGNGTDWSFNGSGFDANQAGAINGTGWLAGGGPIVDESAGAGAPTWLTALPAVAVIGYFGYRRFTRSERGSAQRQA